jgi:hypothetical protein
MRRLKMPEPWEKAIIYIKPRVIAMFDGELTNPKAMSIQAFYTISINYNPYKSKDPIYEIKLWESAEQLDPYVFCAKAIEIYTE